MIGDFFFLWSVYIKYILRLCFQRKVVVRWCWSSFYAWVFSPKLCSSHFISMLQIDFCILSMIIICVIQIAKVELMLKFKFKNFTEWNASWNPITRSPWLLNNIFLKPLCNSFIQSNSQLSIKILFSFCYC